MTTERMTEAERSKIEEFVEVGHVLSDDQASALLVEVDRARRVEQEQAEKIQDQARLIVSLREQLRLTNDKMAEQVRQARVGVADEALALWEKGWKPCLTFLEAVRNTNAPKD